MIKITQNIKRATKFTKHSITKKISATVPRVTKTMIETIHSSDKRYIPETVNRLKESHYTELEMLQEKEVEKTAMEFEIRVQEINYKNVDN